jgi:glycosyltransferase involved in cell wall biosynthesis
MKFIINTSNLYVGGGVQVALSFVNELKQIDKSHEYHIFMSLAINAQLSQRTFADNFKFYLIENSPSSLKTRKKIVAILSQLEEQIKPDIVFTVFGPSYWRPKVKHIMGFALPWMINPHSVAYERLPLIQRLKMRLLNWYKKFYVRNDADFYVVETEDVKHRMDEIIGIKSKNIFVVGNTHSSLFDEDNFNKFDIRYDDANTFKLVAISHNYPHKNLKIIKEVVPYLKESKIDFVFYVTVDKSSYDELFAGVENIVNLGPIETKYCPSIYQQCDAMFLPTLLECFSASYPEAMKMKLPILTSNYSFAEDICKDAALYFDPLDPKDIAAKIKTLINDHALQKKLVENGVRCLKMFQTAQSRAEKYIELCEKIANDKILTNTLEE